MLAIGVLMEHYQQARRDLLVVPQSVSMATSQQLENRLSKPGENQHEQFPEYRLGIVPNDSLEITSTSRCHCIVALHPQANIYACFMHFGPASNPSLLLHRLRLSRSSHFLP